MRSLFLLLIPALFLASCASDPPVLEPALPSEDEAKAVITEKITMAAEKWASGDPMAYVDVAAPDISWMDDLAAPVPVKTREELKTYLEGFKGKIPPHQFELYNFYFQFYEDIVIITYYYQGSTEEMKMPPWKVTAVYRYTNEDWLSVHENWTKVDTVKDEEDAAG